MAAETNPIPPQTRPDGQAKWTVMVYMAAGDDPVLDGHAVEDLREMEWAGIGSEVNVVVQVKRFWPGRAQRYRVEGTSSRLVRADVVDDEPIDDRGAARVDRARAESARMSDGPTLANFLEWSVTHYPADHYFLVLWGHAYGLGFGREHGDPLTLQEIKSAVDHLRTVRSPDVDAKDRPPLELLGANACAMSYAEAACELAGSVAYLVASEISVPFAGWPYETILRCLSQGPNGGSSRTLTPEELGTLVVDRYVGHENGTPGGGRVAMSLLDLSRADELPIVVAALAKAIAQVVDGADKGAGDRRAHVRAAFLSTAAGDVRPLLDFYDLAKRLDALCADLAILEPPTNHAVHAALEKLKGASAAVMSLVEADRHVPVEAAEGRAGAAPLVVCHHQHPDLSDLHGLGIFAPFVTDDRDLRRLGLDASSPTTGRPAYERLSLVKDTRWTSLVFDTLRGPLPAEVVATVEGSGARSRTDRMGVTQLLGSVDALMDTLDRRIAATRLKALENLPAAAGAGMPGALDSSALNLLGKLQLLRHGDIDAMLEGTTSTTASATLARTVGGSASGSTGPSSLWGLPSAGTTDQAAATAQHFLRLEESIADVERTVRRTLTNGTFGLGPGLGAPDKDGLGAPDKDGLGARDKDGLGAPDKDGLGARDKDGLGARDKDGLGISAGGAAEPTPVAVVGGLFRQVAVALRALEEAGGVAETIATKALLAPAGLSGLEPLANVTLAKARLERAFRTLTEASANLRRTLRRVVAHPTYGVGPGPSGLTGDDRLEIARASGLSSDRLALL